MHKRCSPPDNGCAASAPTDCTQLLNVVAMRLHFPSRSFAFASKALALATALSLGLSSFSLQAMGNDTQEIKLGSHVFLVSREWISDGSVTISPEPEKGPPSEPNLRSATELSFRPRAGWLGGTGTALPTIIRVVAAVWDRPPPNSQLSKWLDKVASSAADDDGFVRVLAGFARPGEQPQTETFIYKGYRNDLGQPLVVISNNQDLSPGFRLNSIVTIALQPGLVLTYYFDNRKFPKNEWWALYQRVCRFVRTIETSN
jgi:hypothetical protein